MSQVCEDVIWTHVGVALKMEKANRFEMYCGGRERWLQLAIRTNIFKKEKCHTQEQNDSLL